MTINYYEYRLKILTDFLTQELKDREPSVYKQFQKEREAILRHLTDY